MVQRCCVPHCISKVGDLDIYGIKIRFHRMPHTADRFLAWCKLITDDRRLTTVLTSNSRVCSKHFRKEDYVLKKPFGNNPLKLSAEPCIFKWNSACFENDHLPNSIILAPGDHTGEEDGNSGYRIEDDISCNPPFEMTFNKSLRIDREIQCTVLNEKLFKEEIGRKNTIIEQLLSKITTLEGEQKEMENRLVELRAASQYYQKQIDEARIKNKKLEEKLKQKNASSHGYSRDAMNSSVKPIRDYHQPAWNQREEDIMELSQDLCSEPKRKRCRNSDFDVSLR